MSSTLLYSFAHPDDESFSGAGTAMKYAARGVRTILVTATLGERGKTGDPAICTVAELPGVRERELRRGGGDHRVRRAAPARIPRQGAGGRKAGGDSRKAGDDHSTDPSRCRDHVRSERLQRPPGSRRYQPLHLRRDCGCRGSPLARRRRRAACCRTPAVDAAPRALGHFQP